MKALLELYFKAGLSGSVIILLILLLRLALRKAPRQLMCILWLMAAARLLLPFQVESSFSLQPAYPETLVGVLNGNRILPVLYIVVATGALIYGFVAYFWLKRRVHSAIEGEDGVLEAEGIQSAFVLGYIKPKIYLPLFLQPSDRHHIIAHEKAHILRGDNWWKLLGFMCLCLHWYNPLVWVAYTLFCRDTEVACDERIVWGMDLEKRKEYTFALLNSGKRASGLPALVLCFGKESLKQRIKNVLSYQKPGLAITAITGMLVVLVGICFMTTPPKDSTEPTGDSRPIATESTTEAATEETTVDTTEGETQAPTGAPTQTPTEKPTERPTEVPTEAPTQAPTEAPTEATTKVPVEPVVLSGECGEGVAWAFEEGSGQLTISGSGAMIDYLNHDAQPWAHLRERITKLVISEGVTRIGACSFAQSTVLRSVTIHASVTRIERSAFENCMVLKKLTIAPDSQLHTIGVLAFANTAINEFDAPASLRTIGQQAFSNCRAMEKLSLTGGVRNVEPFAFEYCTRLKTLLLGQKLLDYGWDSQFTGCRAIEYVESYLPSAATATICRESAATLKTYIMKGNHDLLAAVGHFTALSTVKIESPIELIGIAAFEGCTSLKNLEIPDTVTAIADRAFANTGLEELTVPASVTYVGASVFENCPIKKVVFLGDAPPIDTGTFWGVMTTVYYPANAPKWKEQMETDLYPTVTWVATE